MPYCGKCGEEITLIVSDSQSKLLCSCVKFAERKYFCEECDQRCDLVTKGGPKPVKNRCIFYLAVLADWRER